jgi:hypothetical protein
MVWMSRRTVSSEKVLSRPALAEYSARRGDPYGVAPGVPYRGILR